MCQTAKRCRFAILLLVAATVTRAEAQVGPAPFYSLPDGRVWVEYEWTSERPGCKKEAGILLIRTLGHRNESPGGDRWIEIECNVTEGPSKRHQVRRLLVVEKLLDNQRPVHEAVTQGFAQDHPGGRIMRLSVLKIADFVSLGIQGPSAQLTEVGRVEQGTGIGRFLTRHVTASGNDGKRLLQYHGWLTSEAPFGWARFEIHESADGAAQQIVFRAVAQRSGHGADSRLDTRPHSKPRTANSP